MKAINVSQKDDYYSLMDITSIEDAPNKILECDFFLNLAQEQKDREKFRWIVSAFLNAAYSYFEMTALKAYFSLIDKNAEHHPDIDQLNILCNHIKVRRSLKNPYFVKTSPKTLITKKLYALRRENTHYFPLSIVENGDNLPEGFQFGAIPSQGNSILEFCREIVKEINLVQSKIDQI